MTRVGGFKPVAPPVAGEPKNVPPFTRPVVKPTPAKTPAPGGAVAPRKPVRQTQPALTPEQLAQQSVQESLAPLYAQAQSREQMQQQAVAEFTRQLIAQLANIPQLTQADYSQAEAGQSQIAEAAGAALKAANPDAQLQRNLGVIGAPSSQQSQVSGLLNNAFNGGGAVQMYTGGVLPVGTMAADEAAALTNERQLPAIEALRGQQALGQVLGNYQQTVQGLDAQQPDLVQKYVASYTAARQKAAEDAATNAYRRGELGLAAAKANAASQLGFAKLAQAAQNSKQLNSYRQGLLSLRQQGLITDAQYKQATLALKQQSLARGSRLQAKNVNGHTLVFDPSTGTYYIPGTSRAVNPNSPQFAKPPKPLSVSTRSKLGTLVASAKAGEKDKNGNVVAPPIPDVSANDPKINKLYTNVIDVYGVDAKQAFKIVSRFFPGWAARNQKSFFGTMPGTPARGTSDAKAANVNTTGMDATTLLKLPSLSASPQQAKQLASRMASAYGWGPSEMASLLTLWNNESGWNFQAKNPSSGALGIPQALGHTLPANYARNTATQIAWGLQYIKDRYGSPSNALAFWMSNNPHWY